MTNFSFIQHNWPEVAKEAKLAEKYVFKEPRYSALQCRIALEKAAHWMYDNDPELEKPWDTTLASMLHQNAFKDLVGYTLSHELALVKSIGNNGAHGNVVTENEAFSAVKNLFRFCAFLSRMYSEDNPKIPAFSEDFIPKSEKESFRKQELIDIQAKLNAQIEAYEKLKKESDAKIEANESLLAEKQAHQQVVKSRRVERQNDLGNAEVSPLLVSEAETRKLYIDVLLREAGWDIDASDVKEFPVIGMPITTNPTGNGFVDYVLWGDNGLPLAVVEAKKTMVDAKKGKHQALQYADCLERMTGQRPVMFHSNGFEHWIWDDNFYPERGISGFYTKDELQLLVDRRNSRTDIRKSNIDKHIAGRAYQYEAIKRITDTFATQNNYNVLRGKNRKALLVMATGTGKTRTAAALVDLLMKANWVKRVLFLADRNALVTQAKDAFNEYLPHITAIDLTKEKENDSTRLVFSTYPTIMNRIDGIKNGDERFYGVGHFDLIVIDEAHRSVYVKYKAIFEYFDALLVGLTATPVKHMDRNTYDLFEIEEDQPTFAYELAKAVEQEFLRPPKAVYVPIKFPREGIKYHELSAREKEEYELKFGDPTNGEVPDEISPTALNKWLFNSSTVDEVLTYLMANGIKSNGEHIGKTIIFAFNHRHALFIEERFNHLFPEYSGHFLRVIDNYEPRAEDILTTFKNPKKEVNPIIAVSVDMMDTGIDAPRVVNLVFFKRVYSTTKYWQMIGRGTRLCPDLFGPGIDKDFFYIFDFCGNFEFFGENPEGIIPNPALTLSQQIFLAKLEISQALLDDSFQQPELQALRKNYIDQLHKMIIGLDEKRFVVRQHLRYVKEYSQRTRWENLSQSDLVDIGRHLSGLSDVLEDGDDRAKRFDLLMLSIMLHTLNDDVRRLPRIKKVMTIATELLRKQNITEVQHHVPILRNLTEPEFWKAPAVGHLEEVRICIRELVKFLDSNAIEPVYTTFKDETQEENIKEYMLLANYINLKAYRDRLEGFIRKNSHHISIHKLKTNQPLTKAEVDNLEAFLFKNDELGTKEDYLKEFGEKKLGVFIRSIVGLDIQAAQAAFADFLHSGHLNPNQITFIETIIGYLTTNGTIDKSMLFEPPFTDMHDQGASGIFKDSELRKMIGILDGVNGNAEVG